MDKATKKDHSTIDLVEGKLVAFAEQLGSLVGTVQAKAEGWRDRTALTREIGRIRDSAADLLAQLGREDTLRRKAPARRTATASTKGSRGPVDARGKRHRKRPPHERIDPKMGEPQGKQMGQKNFKSGRRSGRG